MLMVLGVNSSHQIRVISPESTDSEDILSDLQDLNPSDMMLIRDGENVWSGRVYQFKRGMKG